MRSFFTSAIGSMRLCSASRSARSCKVLRIWYAEGLQRVEHAAVDRLGEVEQRRSRTRHDVGVEAFRAAVGTAGDDAGADHVLGMRHLELAGHVGAGRDAGDGRRVALGLVARARLAARCIAAAAEQRRQAQDRAAGIRRRVISARAACGTSGDGRLPLLRIARHRREFARILEPDGDAVDAAFGVDDRKLDEAAAVRLPDRPRGARGSDVIGAPSTSQVSGSTPPLALSSTRSPSSSVSTSARSGGKEISTRGSRNGALRRRRRRPRGSA